MATIAAPLSEGESLSHSVSHSAWLLDTLWPVSRGQEAGSLGISAVPRPAPAKVCYAMLDGRCSNPGVLTASRNAWLIPA